MLCTAKRIRQLAQCVVPTLLLCLVAGCANQGAPRSLHPINPLFLDDRVLLAAQVPTQIVTPDLLAIDEDMREFVRRYTGDLGGARQRLVMLHGSVKGPGTLDMQYDPFADGSAKDAFHRGSANCLSYAHLFVALAREAGLDAHYQWMEVRPQWTRMGERVAVRLHVNVVVKMRRGEQYMVDIDPLESRETSGSRLLSDIDAQALYHNNAAMDALSLEHLEQAWMHAARAIQLSPEMGHLWVNIGAIYRRAGQHRDAESSYLYALQLNNRDRSAMNNLVVLYDLEGRDKEHAYWTARVEQYRSSNPYYHSWLGDKAAEAEDWGEALQHYQKALKILPKESHLLYTTGLIHYQLQDLEAANKHISLAIEAATLRRDIDTYQMQLDVVKQEQLAKL